MDKDDERTLGKGDSGRCAKQRSIILPLLFVRILVILIASVRLLSWIFFHVYGYHDSCPKTMNTWCKYQKDKLQNKNIHKYKADLPIEIRKVVYPTLKCLENVFTIKLNMLINRLTAWWFGTASPNPHMLVWIFCLQWFMMLLPISTMVEKLHWTLRNSCWVFICLKKLCRTVIIMSQTRRSSSYRMSESQKTRQKILRYSKTKQKHKNIDWEGPFYKAGGFESVYFLKKLGFYEDLRPLYWLFLFLNFKRFSHFFAVFISRSGSHFTTVYPFCMKFSTNLQGSVFYDLK